MLTIGFVGTGTLTEAVVTGLLQTHAGRCRILLSPRSEAVSRRLAQAHEAVERCAGNAEVVERSDVVVLAVLPKQLAEVTAELAFRPGQLIVSFIAGAPIESVKALVAPAETVVRVIPLPPIRFRKGPVVIHPANARVEELFGRLGDLIVVDKESELTSIGHASAVMSSHYELQNRVIGWLETRGLPEAMAALYVRSLFAGLGELGLDAARRGEPVDPVHHETAGGLNECGRGYLLRQGWFDEVGKALDAIEKHVPSKPKG
ncbi:NAD(P)-binding domain-containing protein [Ancylobacter sp. Lp-2]|uniref:NAD(P)-binding domain-containing protein n=1 Tax=Ancylobacter sp. Lp-2 TaxID=2881339 RepID=UPI001E39A417|nr:NAD(P)-binding domain-containing protein [Ancylobacter sp. Lp-2]MCB4768839.1 NAD(P)-binding domain-containing protein [Ancylobacter sp. Lp-2]